MPIARTMQLVGYALWAVTGLAPACHFGVHLLDRGWWVVAYGIFGLAFHAGASVPCGPAHYRRRLAALALMAPALVAMAALIPCTFGAVTLVIVASQAALVLSARATAFCSVALTGLVACFLLPDLGLRVGLAQLIGLIGFQAFAVAAIYSARRETEAREQLVATRLLLNEACRAQERERISRDLHDALGHSLTALRLQLEIASHLDEGGARVQVAKARDLTARLLTDVREVVAKTKSQHPGRLAAAIRAVLVEVPGLALHLDVPESLVVEESSRAECVVRCIQEIVTNARRHARAQNVWIYVRRDDDAIAVEAHDDGLGAEAPRDGQGLRGMRSRFEEMGGSLEVLAEPRRSFAIRARIPLQSAAVADEGAS